MRIYLQQPSVDGNVTKFCHLHLQEDLIDGWTVVREAGQQGKAGRVKRSHYQQHDDAMEALIKFKDQHVAKGFKIVFAQGETSQT